MLKLPKEKMSQVSKIVTDWNGKHPHDYFKVKSKLMLNANSETRQDTATLLLAYYIYDRAICARQKEGYTKYPEYVNGYFMNVAIMKNDMRVTEEQVERAIALLEGMKVIVAFETMQGIPVIFPIHKPDIRLIDKCYKVI